MAQEQVHIQFGRIVNRLRTARGWTQEQLAEKADIHRRYLQKIEAGERRATINTVAKLRHAFAITWDEFLSEIEGDPYPMRLIK